MAPRYWEFVVLFDCQAREFRCRMSGEIISAHFGLRWSNAGWWPTLFALPWCAFQIGLFTEGVKCSFVRSFLKTESSLAGHELRENIFHWNFPQWHTSGFAIMDLSVCVSSRLRFQAYRSMSPPDFMLWCAVFFQRFNTEIMLQPCGPKKII